MRVIVVRTLKEYFQEFSQAEQTLLSWYEEVSAAEWNNPNQLKASIEMLIYQQIKKQYYE